MAHFLISVGVGADIVMNKEVGATYDACVVAEELKDEYPNKKPPIAERKVKTRRNLILYLFIIL